MKREKNFYYFLTIILFVTIYITAFILAARKVEIVGIIAVASIFVYPLTYLITVLFRERYGKEKAGLLSIYAIFGLLISASLIALASSFPALNKADGLETLFSFDFRVVFASVVSFLVSQNLCIAIYDYLEQARTIKFLAAAVIASTVDAIIFSILAFLGTTSLANVITIFAGQYVFNVIAVVIYSFIFANFVKCMVKNREIEIKEELVKLEKESIKVKKAVTKKVASAKKTTVKKAEAIKKDVKKKVDKVKKEIKDTKKEQN